MRTLSLFLLAIACGLAACSGDTAPSDTSVSSDSSTSAAGLTLVADTAGFGDSVVAGSTVPVNVHVLRGTAPAANVLVTFSIDAGGGSVASTTALSDANGLATVAWTVGDTAQANTLMAAITGADVTVTTNTIAGAVATLARVSPDSQALVAGAALTMTVQPVDQFGNAVTGVDVAWSASAGTLTATSTLSGADGKATTNFVTDPLPSSYVITASVPGQASVTFIVVGS